MGKIRPYVKYIYNVIEFHEDDFCDTPDLTVEPVENAYIHTLEIVRNIILLDR